MQSTPLNLLPPLHRTPCVHSCKQSTSGSPSFRSMGCNICCPSPLGNCSRD